jgi:hypothetical protein
MSEAATKNPTVKAAITPLKHHRPLLVPVRALQEGRSKLLFEFYYAEQLIDFALPARSGCDRSAKNRGSPAVWAGL